VAFAGVVVEPVWQPLGDDPVLGEESELTFDEAGDGRGFLVVVELGIGEP
jgi:hypothetical protein